MRAEGFDPGHVFQARELAGGHNLFFAATGITDGEMLGGVRFAGQQVETHSVVMRSFSGTIRWIDAVHDLTKLRARASEA